MTPASATTGLGKLRSRLLAEPLPSDPAMAAAYQRAADLIAKASAEVEAAKPPKPAGRHHTAGSARYGRHGYLKGFSKVTIPRTAAALRIRERRGKFEVYGTRGRAVVETFDDGKSAAEYIADQLRIEAELRDETLTDAPP